MELYKYCDKDGVNILRHKALKISRIDEFNNPYEFRIAKSDNEKMNNNIDALYKYQKEAYRVVCFSSQDNNIILWSHYSKNHTGILIKFDTDLILVNGNENLSLYLEEVEYKNDMIEIPPGFMELERNERMAIIKKNTHRKYTDWKYEGEYRGIVTFDHSEYKRYIELNPKSILEVVIGLNYDLDTELSIKNILASDEYGHVILKRAMPHDNSYKMKYVAVTA
jgi:Protein of unknown function (DUF2971)